MNAETPFGPVQAPSRAAVASDRSEDDALDEDPSLYLRTQFLRKVAHDIASPTGVTMTVLDELAATSQRPELVAMARRGLRRLLRLSDQLALASDLESGAVVPDTAHEDLRRLTEGALEQAVGIDGRREIKTSCELPDARVVGSVDRRLLSSALREIIGNALRFATSRVAVAVAVEDRRAVIRIQDDGPGFSEAGLATIEQRFSPHARGLGLSLSIAREVLAAHGGDLTITRSTLPPGRRGVGAAVVVTLPLV